MTTCQSCRHAWAQFRITWTQLQHMCARTHTHTHKLSLFWPSLVPVVVYPDWTMWLPCGCQAAPLLCGNWCQWYCRVAAMLWLTGLATCPALPANMAWRGARREGGGWHRAGRGWRLGLSHGAEGLRWNMWWPNTRQIQQDSGDGICLCLGFQQAAENLIKVPDHKCLVRRQGSKLSSSSCAVMRSLDH